MGQHGFTPVATGSGESQRVFLLAGPGGTYCVAWTPEGGFTDPLHLTEDFDVWDAMEAAEQHFRSAFQWEEHWQ